MRNKDSGEDDKEVKRESGTVTRDAQRDSGSESNPYIITDGRVTLLAR